eukprot:scaffold88396_cov33-Tisochrysis_lutea.AAC.2
MRSLRVQQWLWINKLSLDRHGKLPAKVRRVLHSHIHSLPTKGGMAMAGVAAEEDPPRAVMLCHARRDPKGSAPLHTVWEDRGRRRAEAATPGISEGVGWGGKARSRFAQAARSTS